LSAALALAKRGVTSSSTTISVEPNSAIKSALTMVLSSSGSIAASIRRRLISMRAIRARSSAAINRRLSVSAVAVSGDVPA
jgi:hypothetical protein